MGGDQLVGEPTQGEFARRRAPLFAWLYYQARVDLENDHSSGHREPRGATRKAGSGTEVPSQGTLRKRLTGLLRQQAAPKGAAFVFISSLILLVIF